MAKKKESEDVKYTKIVLDDKARDSVQIDFDGNVVWMKRDAIKINKTKKTVNMPTWLKEIKGIL